MHLVIQSDHYFALGSDAAAICNQVRKPPDSIGRMT